MLHRQLANLSVLLLLSLPVLASPVAIDSLLAASRESAVTDAGHPLLQSYMEVRFSDTIAHCGEEVMHTASTAHYRVLAILLEGHCELLGPDRHPAQAYQRFLQALDESRRLGALRLEVEALRSLIRYGLFHDKNLNETPGFIKSHGDLAYDHLEQMWNEYYQLRYWMQREQLDSIRAPFSDTRWIEVIETCMQAGYHRLESELRCVYAVKLGVGGQVAGAIAQNEAAIHAAGKIDDEYAAGVAFTAMSNTAITYLVAAQYDTAIIYFRKVLDLGRVSSLPQNQVRLYAFLAQCYQALEQYDSAYHYSALSRQTEQASKAFEHAALITEIQQKYDNEKLTREKQALELARKQTRLTAVTIISLLSIVSLLILLAYLRYRQQSERTMARLRDQEQALQLAAVNAKLDGQDETRRNLAHYLHDHVVGQLVAANMHLKLVGNMQKGPSLQQSAQLVHDAGVQLRQLSHELYPPVLMQLGLGPALQDLVQKYTHPDLHIALEGDLDQVPFKGAEASKVYYVVQELLNNVVKHSQATTCTLEVQTSGPGLQLRVQDNGRGFDPGRSDGTGLGLSGVRARIRSLSGHFHLHTRPGAGTRIQIDIPLDRFNT